MKSTLRIMSLLLCLLLCVGAIACATSPEDPADTTPTPAPDPGASSDDGNTPPPADTPSDTSAQSSLPDLNFNNTVITTLYWDDVERQEFFAEGENADNVNDAIWARNLAVEEQLGVTLEYIGTPGNVDHCADFLNKLKNSFSSGEQLYNITAAHSRTGAVVAAGGMGADLLDIDDSYLDFDNPWWPSTMVDTATIGNSMYFVSGDISTNTLHFMYGVYYNADIVTDRGLDDPTELALAGTWTLDKMIAMTDNMYEDLNQNSTSDFGDFFGLSTLFYHADAFYSAAGMTWIDKDTDGSLKLSEDFASEKSITLAQKLTDWFASGVCFTKNNNNNVNQMFADGNVLFTQNRIYIADNQHNSGLHDATFTYCVVPCPKYDEAQERYYTTVGNPFTLYGIMAGSKNQDISTAVLECLGYHGYNLTTPAIFEVNMKYKYSAGDKTSQCFDLIRSNIVFDLGRIFGENLNKMSEIWSKACINGQGWASSAKSQSKILTRAVKNLNDTLGQ